MTQTTCHHNLVVPCGMLRNPSCWNPIV